MGKSIEEILQLAEAGLLFSKHFQSTQKVEVKPSNLLPFIDYTTLKATDSVESVYNFAQEAIKKAPEVAALCVHPNFAEVVSGVLEHSSIRTATVATAFPEGQTFLEVKLLETQLAVSYGAEEIDMLIHRGMLLSKNYQGVLSEIKEVKKACGHAHLKVIIETCDLENEIQIAIASALAMFGGADFIKTSTGKGAHGATLNHAQIMLSCILKFKELTGRNIGFKAAGGISTFEEAEGFYQLTLSILGEEWQTPAYFRLGASRLLDVLLQDEKQ